ncbi:MAG: cobalt-zinc-cadmium resistance protein [Phycisphaeraceae bacterium]|nr:cobalt-zinc-cadmium resistance protein [Phycisphaeraceae bacterium]
MPPLEPGAARGTGGAIGWMVHNRVTPNLVMLLLLIGGGVVYFVSIRKEVFPEFSMDTVTVRVPYPGASPEEVEQGVVLAVEDGLRGLDGIKKVSATASEGIGTIAAELMQGADHQKAYQDVQQEVDRITTFPDDAEEPVISMSVHRRRVLEIQLYGEVGEWALREAAEQVRDRLLQAPGLTQIDLRGARDYEVLVEVPQENLRAHGLTLADVSARLRGASVEVPAGSIDTSGGEVLVRVMQRRDWAREFARIPVVTTADGVVLHLDGIADVSEGFEDSDVASTYDGRRSIGLSIYRVGDQTPAGVSKDVRAAMSRIEPDLPPGIEWVINSDQSKLFTQRERLLMRNIGLGLLIVVSLLGLFLEMKLAFWVMMGIPISFLGGIMFLPMMGASINMISMFAFIVALGIVVDDAIVAGENIYEYRQRGMGLFDSAIQGTRDVAVPITFAVLTNILAFIPLAMVPGFIGKIWKVIPMVVCTVFAISLVESLFILPAHLAHTRSGGRTVLTRWLHGRQQAFSGFVREFIYKVYGPFLDMCVRRRTITVAVSLAILIVSVAFVASGRLGMSLMPRVESDLAVVTAELPVGSRPDRVAEVGRLVLDAGRRVAERHGGDDLVVGFLSQIDDNSVEVRMYLTDPEIRPISTSAAATAWRRETGEISGLESIKFEADRGGPGGGAAISIELSHRHIPTLERAAGELAERIGEFAVTSEIDDGFGAGKRQLDFRITPEGRSLGLTAGDIARQVRHAYQGDEAIKQQRGRNEVTIRVRLPQSQRVSEFDLEGLIIRTPDGGEVPLMEVASVERGRAYTSIERLDGRRTMTVTADVHPRSETSRVMATLVREVLPGLVAQHPELTWQRAGRQADFSDSMDALLVGLGFALAGIYFLLAVPFRNYLQPMIVMSAIPFGIVGAIIGHLIMGYTLSIISMMGIIALAGVVVNDSLVLVDYANRLRREEGFGAFRAIHEAGTRRFRPILLTTLTTFGGLAPMIFETSRQARFMIPMAISLGYGIVFATAITLVIVPSLYMLIEDARAWIRSAADWIGLRQAKEQEGVAT